MSLAMSLRGRGPSGSAARTARVLSRFGATAGAMTARLERYRAVATEFGVRPTWPTTACVLARHPELLKRYADGGAELAVHGLVHGDHAMLGRDQQRETIARAVGIFERAGLDPSGFRGPYLRYNDATLEVLAELGFRYHSSQAVAFPRTHGGAAAASGQRSYDLALDLYAAHDATRLAVRPRVRGALVDIPVAIPDDEIILERLHLDPPARVAEWLRVFERCYRRGDLFTLQLHPERIVELEDALRVTLAEARRLRPRVFVARLDELAAWWWRRDRFSLCVRRTPDGGFRVQLDADRDATLLVRGLEVPSMPWRGRDAVAVRPSFEVAAGRMPVVGISRRTPADVAGFLAEEGLPFEVSDEPGAYGAYLDIGAAHWNEATVLDAIDEAPGPLVRLWRWPNGAGSALAITGDIDALTLKDFLLRSWETSRISTGRWAR
ncbi:MAG TPA: polysaccharide deacetylase family protein [Candidatus Limnocylindria bacterium]|nr:polysaccharide deacetylase family protein [Candidatus Limnocylindria bacterium]